MSNKLNQDKVKALIHRIGLRHNLSDDVVKDIIGAPYEFAEKEIRKLKLMDITSEEELEKTKTNFLFKHIGRIYVLYSSIQSKRNRIKNMNKVNKERWKKN